MLTEVGIGVIQSIWILGKDARSFQISSLSGNWVILIVSAVINELTIETASYDIWNIVWLDVTPGRFFSLP